MSDDKKKNSDERLYQDLLGDSIEEFNNSHSIDEKQKKKIIKTGKNRALLTNIMISLAVLLLIIPILTLGTYLYYGGTANHLIDISSKTIYVTEPNLSLEEIELEDEIGLFSMDITFDVFKKIGSENYRVGDYDIHFTLDKPNPPKKSFSLERPQQEYAPSYDREILFHPEGQIPNTFSNEWSRLKGLPDGTVAEVYLSFNKLMKPNEIKEKMPQKTELRWFAVDTGVEIEYLDAGGNVTSPIGYPVQPDTTIWAPFNGREQTNEEEFIDILKQLKKDEHIASTIARAKSLALPERIAYLEKNGIHVYGAVITGPVTELRKLEDVEEVRAMRVGEVKLWNY